MKTTSLDTSDGWPPLPSGPPPVPPTKVPTSSLPSLSSSSFPPSIGSSSSGTPPPPGESRYDTPPPPGDDTVQDASSKTGLAAWENAQKALAELNPSPQTIPQNSNKSKDQDNVWQAAYPPWGAPPPRFHPPYGHPFPRYGYPRPSLPGMRPLFPPWHRPPQIRGGVPHMGAQQRQPMWGAAKSSNPSNIAIANTIASTTGSQHPIRFNLQYNAKPSVLATTPLTSPGSIPLPAKPIPLSSESPKNVTPG